MSLANGFTRLLQLISGARTRSIVIDLSTDAPTVIPGPVILRGVYVTVVMSAHTVALSDNAVNKVIIPASTTANTSFNALGMKFATDLTITPNASSTGTITVTYDEL